ncbi:Ubp1-associated protein 2a [Thalictrum thalictroides]|uniref:Ubp1-associated protein 2a n=1 Tax=Thalictrum thalictroides TaxID=46969 RepID=A0A7J6W304_THATH|nr:Ubp1-associated protein 2a [Thalictrum thalictroides]
MATKIQQPISNDEEDEEYIETSEDDEGVDYEDEEEEVEEEEEEEEEQSDEQHEEEQESDDSKRDSVRKLLEPFGKDQLIEILKEAALKNPSIIDRIIQSAETDTIHRKIFVHGLGWDATNETLIDSFKEYGDIEIGNVVNDKVTGKSKGYGFVQFKTRDGAQKALEQPQKKIGNRMTSCQLASFGPVPNHPIQDSTGRKIYVANVGAHLDVEKLRAFFAKFGEIEEGPLGYDRVTGKLRGFALFVYKTAEGCKKALEEPVKFFEGCQLQCKRAVEGLSKKKYQAGEAVMVSVAPPAFPPVNFPTNYAMGLNPGMAGQNVNPLTASLVGQSTGIGLMNPSVLGTSLNPAGYSPSIARGLAPLTNRTEPVTAPLGLGATYCMQSSINSISPSVIGSYGSQAALQGWGAYQNAQMGQPSAATLARPQSGVGSLGTMPTYRGH